jgi:hypothetical protein
VIDLNGYRNLDNVRMARIKSKTLYIPLRAIILGIILWEIIAYVIVIWWC